MVAPLLTLEAVHLVDEGVYLVTGKWGHSFEVDGLPQPKNDFVVQSLEGIRQVVTKRGRLLNYKSESGETITSEDYAAEVARLIGKSYRDSDDEIQFANLDDEFAYRKFFATWSAGDREPDVVEHQPVNVVVTEVRLNSGDPDIQSLWNSPRVDREKTLYTIDRDGIMVRAFYAACEDGGVKGENEGRRYLRFAKIEGGYAFNDSFDESRQKFVGTLEQCKAEKAACIKRVNEVVAAHVAKKRGIPLKGAGTVVIELEGISRRLSSIRAAKQSHASELLAVRKSINDLIASIRQQIA